VVAAPLTSPLCDVGAVQGRKDELFTALALEPRDAALYVELADLLLPGELFFMPHSGQELDKVGLLKLAIQLDPGNADAFLGLGLAVSEAERVAMPGSDEEELDKKALLLHAIRLNANCALAHAYVALLQRKAELTTTRAQGRPIGVVHPHTGQPMTSIQFCLTALVLDPRCAEAYFHLALCLSSEAAADALTLPAELGGGVLTAHDAITRALAIAPRYAPALTALAMMAPPGQPVVLPDGRRMTPVETLVEALRADPGYVGSYDALITFFQLGLITSVKLWDGAEVDHIGLLLRLLQYNPTHALAFSTLASMLPPGAAVSVVRPTVDVRPALMTRRDLMVEALRCDTRASGLQLLLLAREMGPTDTVSVPQLSGSPLTKLDLLVRAQSTDLPQPLVFSDLAVALPDDEPVTLDDGRRMSRRELAQEAILLADNPTLLARACTALASLLAAGEPVELLDCNVVSRDDLMARAAALSGAGGVGSAV